MEEKLKQSESEFRIAVENNPDFIVFVQRDGRIFDINRTEKGFTREAVVNQNIFNENWYGTKEQAEVVRKTIGYVFQTGTPGSYEYEQKAPDGSLSYYETRVAPFQRDNDGRVLTIQCATRDITERRQAEEKLREAELKYRIVADNTYDWEWWMSPAGDFIYSSPSCHRITGYGALEFMNNAELFWNIIHPVDLPVWDNHRCLTSQSNAALAIEFRILHKDGSERWIEHICQPVFDETGKFQGSRGSNRDITERKKAEEAFRESKEKFSKAFHVNPDIVTINRVEDGVFVDVNDSFTRITGFSREEAIGNDSTLLGMTIIKEERNEIMKLLEKQGVIRDVEYEWRKKSGEKRVSLLSSEIITINGKKHMITISKDITKRKEAEEALRQSKEYWRSLTENSPDHIMLLDKDAHIQFINRTVPDLAKEEVIGKSVYEFTPKAFHKTAEDCFKRVLKNRQTHTYKTDYHTKDGEIRYFEVRITPVFESGEIVGFISSSTDITEHKLLEDERLRAAKLESIGTLAGGIAHDFNNLLTGIMGNIGMAKRYTKPEDKSFERLDEAEKAAVKAKDLTQQLLTFARGGAPVKVLSSLPELIDEAAMFALRGSNVKHELSLKDNLWATEIDKGQIGQVIHNIVVNADEAMPSGGIVLISVSNIVIERTGELPPLKGNYLKIDIKDEGIGMSPEQFPRIFEPYYTTKKKGSGLGLTTAYAIIKNHGGYITMESRPGAGTTFHIYLPASRKTASVQKDVIEQDPVKGKGKILVMDDEEIIRKMLNKMLPIAGYRVGLTGDGAEAITKYVEAKESGQSFDAVIMDLTIPGGMGGQEAIKKLLKIDPRVKAIVSSGYATDPIMADYRKYGFSAVITKPYSVSQMEETLREVLKVNK